MFSSGAFGTITNFDHLTCDWDTYKSRLAQWFIANDINDASDKSKVKRKAILLSALSEASYKLACDLALPHKLPEVEFDRIIELLDSHFTPKRLGFAERYNFYSAMQRRGESHTQWAARIRGLATHCGFKSLEEALLDKFVMGMAAGPEREKLFAKDHQDMTLAKAVELAESVSAARKAATATCVVSGALGNSALSNSAHGNSGAASDAAGSASLDVVFNISKNEKCSVCGYSNHKSNQCRFKNYKCKKCNRKGHLGRMCAANSKVNYVSEGTTDVVDDGDDGESHILNIKCVRGRPMTERVQVNGIFLEFEIDSGSAVNVVSEHTYKSHFKEVPLSDTARKFFTYTGDKIVTVGFIQLPVDYMNKKHVLKFYVVRGGGPPLLGREFLHNFNLEFAPVTKINFMDNKQQERTPSEICSQFPKLFSSRLGCFNKYKISLRLKPDAKLLFFKARPVAFALREKIDAELNRLVTLGILEPIEYSECASPIVPVLKKDGGVRICADYSVTINKQLIIEKYPLPTIDELFAKLHGGEQFTKLDLSRAYNQFVLTEESQALTCINTHRGLYKYTRLVFGLASAPAIFQRAIECVLAGLDGVITFLDDILITGSNINEHKNRLTLVMKRLEDAGLTVQQDKCEYFKNEICYLGHIIDKNGIRKSSDKVQAILKAAKPTNVSQLQSFLGLINYYRNFVPNASSILSSLYELLHKNKKWEWSSVHDEAFDRIKKLLASDQLLAHFDPNAKLILTVDASPQGLGAILSQLSRTGDHERPIAFASRTLTSAEKNYSQLQKEATAIIFGVRRFHQYLYGRTSPFILRTDHKPLLTIFGPHRGIPEVSANRLQRYALFLSAYNYSIEFIRSGDNSADFLSRATLVNQAVNEAQAEERDCEERAAYINFVVEGSLPITLEELRRETDRDEILKQVKGNVLNGWPRKCQNDQLKAYFDCRLQLALENECLMRGHKVVIPHSLREKLCRELHISHFGVVKMKAAARERFWFPGIDAALERMAAACDVCAQLRPSPYRAPPRPWPYPPRPFYRIHLDFLGPFQNQMFLVIVDAFSKWVECYTVTTSYASRAVISNLCDFMSRVGIPHTLVTDNGTSFTSREFKNFCSLNGIRHVLSPVYHPSSNGQAESFVKIIKKGLKGIILQTGTSIPLQEKIAKFLFDYRNSKNSTTGKSPAELVYGRPLRSRLDLMNPLQGIPTSADLSMTVKKNQSLQSRNKGGRQRLKFKINDVVWVKRFLSKDRFCWVKGVVKEEFGNVMYSVYVPVLSSTVIRHIDQIRRFQDEQESELHHKDRDWHLDVDSDNDNDSTSLHPEAVRHRNEDADVSTSTEAVVPGEDEFTYTEPLHSHSSPTPEHAETTTECPTSEQIGLEGNVLGKSQLSRRSKRHAQPFNYKPFF